VVTAAIVADNNYSQATSSPLSVGISLAPQATLVVVATPGSMNVNGTSTLSTTGGSGSGVVSYSLVSGPCTLSGATLTGTGAGSCSVTATKAADSTYDSATSSQDTVVVSLATQATLVVVATPGSINVNGTSTLSTTGGNGSGVVTYNLVSGPCTLNVATLTGTGAGSCIVTATKAADSTYASATSSSAIVTVLQSQESGTTPGGTVNISITGGGFVAGSTQFTAASNPPAGKTFPYGVFDFTAQTTAGGSVVVTITYPQPLPAGTQYLKSINGAWVDWTSRVTVSGSTVTLPLTDGQYGDTNPASGLITDPFGPAVSSVRPSPAPIPTLSEWAQIMMMLMMIATAGLYGQRMKPR
jgi:hypothetical protein